ncbi:MAG: 16S rRNA (cytosine(1402)-N(4))-methyltransferase RsmH [Desulfobacteraceae bacterium]
MGFEHTPVMPEQVRHYLNLKPGNTCIDCTLGGCGHAVESIQAVLPNGRLIGIDQDIAAVENAQTVLEPYKENTTIVHDNFANIVSILESLGIKGADGILLDLGLSLNQLRNSTRGFSFQADEPLDMRMDTRGETTAEHIVNNYSEKELADIFFRFGEERMAGKIARKIIRTRMTEPIQSGRELARIVRDAIPAKVAFKKKTHPATKVFQALRISVNKELQKLETFMDKVPELLNKNGRLVVISFHSLEDRIVKQKIRGFEKGCTCPSIFPECTCGFQQKLKAVIKKPVTPSREEIDRNPMARSAKIRVAQRV